MFVNEKVSIVIPTTRTQSVKNTVDTIILQADNYDYEVILVGTNLSILKDYFSGNRIIFIDREDRCLPSKARNIGVSVARGSIVLFIDDDCEAGRGWFESSMEALADSSVGLVTGRVAGKSNRFFAQCVDFNFYLQQGCEPRELKRFSSITFGMRKQLFNELGGFDENIAVREDIDFSNKVVKKGYRIVYSPGMLVMHNHGRDSFGRFLNYHYKSGLLSGLSVPIKHKKDWKDRIMVNCRNFYFILIFPLALWSTCKQCVFLIKHKKNILLFLPFFLLSHICYQLGVWRWTISYRK